MILVGRAQENRRGEVGKTTSTGLPPLYGQPPFSVKLHLPEELTADFPEATNNQDFGSALYFLSEQYIKYRHLKNTPLK